MRVEVTEVILFSTSTFSIYCLFKNVYTLGALPIIEGLQSELESANKEGDCVRKRLKFQDDQLERIKETTELSAADELNKYGKSFLLKHI